MKRQNGKVYFFQREDNGLIKIGFTHWLTQRRQRISGQVGAKLTMLGYMFGGTKLEAQMHRYFAAYRVYGEWFQPSDDLLDFIAIFTTKIYQRRSSPQMTHKQIQTGIDRILGDIRKSIPPK